MNCEATHFRFSASVQSLSAGLLLWGTVLLTGCQTVSPEPPLPKLLEAVQVGDIALVKQLVAAGEKINQDFERKPFTPTITAMTIAIGRCDQTMIETLIALGATNRALVEGAIKCNNLQIVDMVAGIKGVHLDTVQDWHGHKVTLLGAAVGNGQMELAKLLLAKGAKVDGWCKLGRCEGDWELSPLHVAAKTANVDMVRLLVNRGADTVVLDKNLLAPIIHLVMDKAGTEAQIVEIIKILAVRGIASVKYVSPRGPALGFIPDSWKEAKQLLIALGANQADVARFQREEAERWKKIAEEEEQARLAKEQAAKAATEAEERGVSISSDGKGGRTCTRRSQRWVSGSSGSGMVRGSRGHYEFYDETVSC